MSSPSREYSHCVTALVNASPQRAFDYLCDPKALGEWSIGCMRTAPTERQGVYVGRSLLSGSRAWFSIEAKPELMLVDYHTGSPGNLVPRISARVIGPEVCELESDQCYISLTAWRTATMDADRWRTLCAAHELEIQMIKQNIERNPELQNEGERWSQCDRE